MHAIAGDGGDVDLLIRTGGEKRLSDFLLWESAYAELLFTDRMWPDFDEADLDAAIEEFQHRERRFGGCARPGGFDCRRCAMSTPGRVPELSLLVPGR